MWVKILVDVRAGLPGHLTIRATTDGPVLATCLQQKKDAACMATSGNL